MPVNMPLGSFMDFLNLHSQHQPAPAVRQLVEYTKSLQANVELYATLAACLLLDREESSVVYASKQSMVERIKGLSLGHYLDLEGGIHFFITPSTEEEVKDGVSE